MSVTTTANPATYNIRAVLADYELHHSDENDNDTTLNEHPLPETEGDIQNPPEWPTDQHRRVPPFRPVNMQLDQSQRRVYQNNGERAFIFVMFTGVNTNATLAQVWRKTGGKLRDISYRIGGEW